MKLLAIELNGDIIHSSKEFISKISIKNGNVAKFVYEMDFPSGCLQLIETNFRLISFATCDTGQRFHLNSTHTENLTKNWSIQNYLGNSDIQIVDMTPLLEVSSPTEPTKQIIRGRALYDLWITFGEYKEFKTEDLEEDELFLCDDYDPEKCERQCKIEEGPRDETFNGYCLETGNVVTWKKIRG